MTSPLNDSRLWWARWGVLLLLAMASFLAYLTRHSLAVANTTIQKELGIDNEQFGLLYGAFSLGYMILQVPGGWMGQKLGVRLALPFMAVLWSLTTFATAFMSTFAGLLVIRFLFGLAQAGLVPNQALVVRDWIADAGRGVASAVMVVAMSVGSIASLSLTSWLLRDFPWRSIIVGYSTLGVLWAVVFAFLFRSTPQQVRWLRRVDEESPSESWAGLATFQTRADTNDLCAKIELQTASAPAAGSESRMQNVLRLLSRPGMWGLSVQALLKASAYNLTVTFLPALLEYIHGVPPQEAGALVTWSLVAFIGGTMLGGVFVDRVYRWTGSKFYSRSGLAAAMLVLAGVFTAIAGDTDSAAATAAWLTVAALFSGLASAAPWVAVMDIGGRNTAVVMGVMNSFSALGGVLLSPLVGKLIDFTKATHGDWNRVFWLHAGFYLMAAACWLAVDPDRSLETSGVTHAV